MAQEIYDKTVFKRFFEENDPQVMAWAENVFEKIASPGILPTFINKGGEDFASYWKSVCHLFALVVVYARQMNEIDTNKILFELFIENRGLVTNEITTSEQMQYLFENYVEEYRKRGRLDVVSKEGVILGELLRLIEYKDLDEFIFALLMARDSGWTMGYSSPTWNRTDTVSNITKGYEKTVNIEDLSKYPLINPTGVVIVEDVDNDGNSIKAMTFTGNVKTGISSEEDKSKLLVISPNLPYQVSAKIKITGAASDQKLHFGVQVYDELQRPMSCIEAFTSTVVGQSTTPTETNNFVKNEGELIFPDTNIYYDVRGTISKINRSFSEEVQLNFLNGRGLKFQEGAKYLSLELTQDRTGVQTNALSGVYIYDVKIKPIYLPFYQGYLGEKNVIASYFENNSLSSNEVVQEFIKTYLISYKNIFAAQEIYQNELQTVVLKVFSDDGNYLEGVSVTINGNTYTTNINGEITIQLYPGDYLLNAEKERFEDVQNELVTIVEGGDESQLVYITMTGEVYQRQVTFRVIDENNRAVQGATVTFNGQFQTTGTDGTTSFMVYPGLYNYTVTKDTYYSINRSILVSDDMLETVTLSVIPTYAVTFVVKNSEGQMVTDAVVSIGGKTGNTGSVGSCTIDGLVEGDYVYNVTKSEWISETATIHVDEDMTVNVTMNPIPTYQVQFLVQDVNILIENSETPLLGATVSFAGSTQKTNSQGLLANPFVVKAGEYSYTVTLSGYDQVTGSLTINEDHIEGSEAGVVKINLAKGLRNVTFIVKDENAEIVSAATVKITKCDNEEITSDEAQMKLDSSGKATIRLPEDHDYDFIITPDSSSQYESYESGFTLFTSDKTIEITMFRATTTLNPTVFEEDQNGSFNNSCQGALFKLTCESNPNIPDQSATTNASGKLNTTNNVFRLPIGNYSVEITKDKYEFDITHSGSAANSLEVKDLSPISQSYYMKRETTSFRVRVVDENNRPIQGATVTIASMNLGSTDSNGYTSYSSEIRWGTYSGSITATGYSQKNFTASIDPDTTLITQQMGTLYYNVYVTIVNGNTNRPITSGSANLYGGDYDEENYADSSGTVTFTRVPVGNYTVTAVADNYQSATQTVNVTNDDVRIEISLSAEMINFPLAAYVDCGYVSQISSVEATYSATYADGTSYVSGQTTSLYYSSGIDGYGTTISVPGGGRVSVTYSCDGYCLPVSCSASNVNWAGDNDIIGYLYTAIVFSTSVSPSVSRGYRSDYGNKTYIQGPSLNQRITSRNTLYNSSGSYYIQFTLRNRTSSFSIEKWPAYTYIYLVSNMFDGSSGLNSLPTTTPNFRGTNADYMFRKTGIRSIPSNLFGNVAGLSSSNKMSARYIFSECNQLTSVSGEIFPLYTGYHFHAFDGCRYLSSISGSICGQGGPDDDFSSIFRNCGTYASSLSINGDPFSRSTQAYTIGFAFANCTTLRSYPSSLGQNCSKLTSVYGIFFGCTSLTSANISAWSNKSSLSNCREAFSDCSNLTSVTGTLPTGVTSIYNMFADTAIRDISGLVNSSRSNLSNLTTANGAFKNTNITFVPEKFFANCRKLTSTAYCFQNCKDIQDIRSRFTRVSVQIIGIQEYAYALDWFENTTFDTNTGLTLDCTSMFEGCSNMVITDLSGGYYTGARLYSATNYVGKVNMNRMFYGCSKLGPAEPGFVSGSAYWPFSTAVAMTTGGMTTKVVSHTNTYTGTSFSLPSSTPGWK